MVERLNGAKSFDKQIRILEVDGRNPRSKKVISSDVATLYGQRPKHDDLWYLSPYEFAMYWEPQLVRYPMRLDEDENPKYHATLTQRGVSKIKSLAHGYNIDMEPELDYLVKDSGGVDWLPFADTGSTKHFRHTWMLVRRRRPTVPSFHGAPVPRHAVGQQQRAAMIVMTYFHPWTLRQQDADIHVPHVGELRCAQQSWQEVLTQWLAGNILCAESKRYVGNFLSVHRVRPRDNESDECNSDDLVSDEELQVSNASLSQALNTRIGGKQCGQDFNEGSMSHFQNSEAAISLGQHIWGSSSGSSASASARNVPSFVAPTELEKVFKEATASQKRENSLRSHMQNAERSASLQTLTSATAEDVEAWLQQLRERKDKNNKHVVNAKQFEAVEKIAARVIQELRAGPQPTDDDFGEPLRWCVHGGPGTGKSKHVIVFIKELFEKVLHWDMGVHFQLVALQAVMADLLGGDTIHHALGIPVYKRGETNDDAVQKQLQVAKRVLQWRWLIIDEISMVSAKLLAEVDVKLRKVVRDICVGKTTSRGRDRPFGGLNVVICGDFWQLDPPDGGFLANVPVEYIQRARKYQPAPTVSHGQALLWSGPAFGFQGVTELVECERCDDPWLQSVQQEIREGRLSEDNHAFLHGQATTVPGSWLDGKVMCKKQSCLNLGVEKPHGTRGADRKKRAGDTSTASILKAECGVCKQHRNDRARVATSGNDPRFRNAQFANAPAIFANNDVKYDTNKRRAEEFADKTQALITYSPAKDTPSANVLRDNPGIAANKLQWLQRHDRESGDLYGMLPLIHNMPVALIDHIDRSPDKQLLKGKVGHIHSWVLHGDEKSVPQNGRRVLDKMPLVVFVKFPGAKWKLPGLDEEGLYPIRPRSHSWFLDKGRRWHHFLYLQIKSQHNQGNTVILVLKVGLPLSQET